jgi:ATP-dependent RNA helicase SUPV3L1/SUV3
MISDTSRGHAWTKTFLGAIANEIHLCGEERAIKIIQKLCQITGDELNILKYERLTPLSISKKPVKSIQDLRKGDCVITFSRKEIFAIKNEIEKNTNFKVAVVYGSLPPENRVKQAELFNDTEGDHDILVATDAGLSKTIPIN